MEQRDVIVVGGGLSGLAFAWHAARAGRKVLVLEAAERLGGCLDSRRQPAGYWYELGAHTCYNSYGDLLEIIEGSGIGDRIRPRGEARKRFALLRDGKLLPMGPLSVFKQFDLGELLRALPGAFRARKEGVSTYAYYSGVVGKRNYARVLAPFLSAVPSQSVDAFPATGDGSLFKKRPRRKDVV
jgi:oxygen-dependent protoporphyrinogen oxidase